MKTYGTNSYYIDAWHIDDISVIVDRCLTDIEDQYVQEDEILEIVMKQILATLIAFLLFLTQIAQILQLILQMILSYYQHQIGMVLEKLIFL